MHIRRSIGALSLAVAFLLPTVSVAAGVADQKTTIEDLRQELLQLPYYSVFDFIAFSYDKGTVTLAGYAYALGLKKDAERAAKRVAGVDTVVDHIEDLSPNSMDDQIRWAAYYKIYRDPFLSRYAPGGGMLWGHRHPYNGPFRGYGGAFSGLEPAGNYPIHIIVKGGHITLLGVVDNDSDKTVAGARAREIPGAFGVDNQLMVENQKQSTP